MQFLSQVEVLRWARALGPAYDTRELQNMNHLRRRSGARQVLLLTALLLVITTFVTAQGDRGAIAGRITDPAGAVIPGVKVDATNVATGAKFQVEATQTGDYTIPSLPAGTYTLTVEQAGFRKYEQSGIRVNVAQTIRADAQLVVGAVTETVEVSATASMLKTESADMSQTVQREVINDLPIQWAGQSLVRDPLKFAILTPGVNIGTSWGSDLRFNGLPITTVSVRMDGMDAGSSLNPQGFFDEQPSVDSMEEFTIQTSNFSAEYGQVGGGQINMTARSGTNQFHGSVYDYFVNEKFNAGQPFMNSGNEHVRLRARQQDFGFNIGGPVRIPKVYNGTNKTFFFFNWEQTRNIVNIGSTTSVPSLAMRAGDYSYYLTGKRVGTDLLGNGIFEGQLYDPFSDNVVNGRTYRTPIPGNNLAGLLATRLDPVSAKVQAMIPLPNVATPNNAPINNYQADYPRKEFIKIPSFKIDQSLGNNVKVSAFYTWVQTDRDSGPTAMPYPLNGNRKMKVRTKTFRFNYDHTLSPTMFNHFGIGYRRYAYPEATETTGYDSTSSAAQAIPGGILTMPADLLSAGKVAGLGIRGAQVNGFPVLTGLLTGNLGVGTNSYYYQDKPTLTESLSWARGKHMLKFGGEWRFDTYTNRNSVSAMSTYGFSASQTGLPASEGLTSGGNPGNAYASFLLGLTNSYQVGNVSDPQWRRTSYAWFAQDTFRASTKLTIDYGLRWDWVSGWGELHDRMTGWSPDIAIPTANNLKGGLAFAGEGAGRTGAGFGKSYPWAFSPRLGVAYKFQEKMVLRAGIGVTYGAAPPNQYTTASQSLGHGWNSIDGSAPAYGLAASQFSSGIQVDPAALAATNFSPGLRVLPTLVNAPQAWDQNLGRPPRLLNWNISLQREISKDIVVEGAYVGSRGAWWRADGLQNYNNMTPEYLLARGVDVRNATDRTLLTSRIDSATAAGRNFTKPYSSFPSGSTVAQSLRPYPMYLNANTLWAPVGKNWYDSFQGKFTKRFSQGYTIMVAYTFSKSLADYEGSFNNVWNRGIQKALTSFDQPQMLAISGMYRVPTFSWAQSNRLLDAVVGGWQLGAVLRYTSGTPIQVPVAQSSIGNYLGASVTTPANRVAGQSLFLNDPNSADPRKVFVLNPAAWVDPAPGEWGTSAKYYSDYRNRRRPDEQLSVSKAFKFREGMSLSLRFELFNAFNRLRLGAPTSNNAKATQVLTNGVPQSGFGYVNATSANGATNPRSGQIVARFTF